MPPVPPFLDSLFIVLPLHSSLLRSNVELLHPYFNVRILHVVCFRSTHAKIFMVEEVPHQNANGKMVSFCTTT